MQQSGRRDPPTWEPILAEYCKALRTLPPEESANLLWRPYQEFRAAVENGLFFVIEDAGGNFMAGAGVFDLANPGEKELGMCYAQQEWRGYGLQELLLHVRVCVATLGQMPDKDAGKFAATRYAALITGLKPANAHSAANTAGLGFKPLGTPSAALFMACTSCRTRPVQGAGRKCCCDFFALADARRREVIEKCLQMETWSRTKNGHRLVVALKVRHLLDPDCREALQDAIDELWRDKLRRDDCSPDRSIAESAEVALPCPDGGYFPGIS